VVLKTRVNPDFLNLFVNVISDQDVCNNKLNLFVLNLQNKKFIYNALLEELFEIIIPYALSNSRLEEYSNSYGGKAFVEATRKLRKHSQNEGELGEILLYSFLESHLEAPKLLSKLELKTAVNDYVKGADGVHLLRVNEHEYQIIFGESKMKKSLRDGVYDAFTSINKFINESVGYETTLIDSNIIKESVNDEQYNILKSILIPQRNASNIEVEHSFGMFLGFELEIDFDEENIKSKEYKRKIQEASQAQAESVLSSIENQIKSKKLQGYDFYFYLVPFIDIKSIRKELIKGLKEL